MTNIEKIRQEIERRKKICEGIFERESDIYYQGKAVAYGELLPFIDSLPDNDFLDESIIASKDLEEEIQKAIDKYPLNKEDMSEDDIATYHQGLIFAARHFAEWGRIRFRDTEKSQNEMSENIGQLKKIAAQAYVAQLVLNGKVPDGLIISPLREIAENAFIYGAEWGAKHLK